MTGIYKITNPNGKVYVGQSIDIERRWNRHIINYKNDDKNTHLYNSLKKYGVEKHTFEIIEECKESQLNERERYYQDKYNSIKEGLNSRYTTTADKSGRLSETVKKKISKTKKENPYVFTREQREKISIANIGKVRTEEQRKRQSQKSKGRVFRTNEYSHSEKTKQKISKSNKLIWKSLSDNERNKRNINNRNRWDEELKSRVSKSHKKLWDENKRKEWSELHKEIWNTEKCSEHSKNMKSKWKDWKKNNGKRKVHNSTEVMINNIKYTSIQEASSETGISPYFIKKYYL